MPSSTNISANARRELLDKAADSCFFTGVGDLAEKLCAANMAYGIAKIRFVQQQMGVEPDAGFVGAPDATITRNIGRWNAGFGYGGRIRYSGEFGVLDLKSNCCGMYLGAVSEVPPAEQLLDRIRTVRNTEGWANGTGSNWDFGSSNHFLSVVRFDKDINGKPFGIICHGSGPEFRGPGPHGPGLYLDQSQRLQELVSTIDTPWGPINVVSGPGAEEYWNGLVATDGLAGERRSTVAAALFPEVEEISNTTHQGATALNDYHLGCVVNTGEALVPVALRADLPIFVLVMNDNLSERTVEKLGYAPRAEKLGLLPRLLDANLLPHGGGYTIPGYRKVLRVLERGDARVFEVESRGRAAASAYHTNFRNVPFFYRGEEVVSLVQRLGMGSVVTRGHPIVMFMV